MEKYNFLHTNNVWAKTFGPKKVCNLMPIKPEMYIFLLIKSIFKWRKFYNDILNLYLFSIKIPYKQDQRFEPWPTWSQFVHWLIFFLSWFDLLGLIKIHLDILKNWDLFGYIWRFLELFGALWRCFDPFRVISSNLEQYSSHLEPFRAIFSIWSHLEPALPIWSHLKAGAI